MLNSKELKQPEEIAEQLDKIAKYLSYDGMVQYLEVPTRSGYLFKISDEKYRQAVEAGQNPIKQIFNITANATATSSVSVSQKIQNIIHGLEESNVDPKKLSEARSKLDTLESELNKPNPSEKVIKKVIRWASNFSLELFLRLAVLVAERLLKPM